MKASEALALYQEAVEKADCSEIYNLMSSAAKAGWRQIIYERALTDAQIETLIDDGYDVETRGEATILRSHTISFRNEGTYQAGASTFSPSEIDGPPTPAHERFYNEMVSIGTAATALATHAMTISLRETLYKKFFLGYAVNSPLLYRWCIAFNRFLTASNQANDVRFREYYWHLYNWLLTKSTHTTNPDTI